MSNYNSKFNLIELAIAATKVIMAVLIVAVVVVVQTTVVGEDVDDNLVGIDNNGCQSI